MSDTEKAKKASFKESNRDVWRSYFQAAIGGYLSSGKLDPRTPSVSEIIVQCAANVADAALAEDLRRQPRGGGL